MHLGDAPLQGMPVASLGKPGAKLTNEQLLLTCCCLPIQVKIGDFGFAKRLAPGKSSIHVKRITHPRWVAPEVGTELQTTFGIALRSVVKPASHC
jgi:serine/threonine protein kinase